MKSKFLELYEEWLKEEEEEKKKIEEEKTKKEKLEKTRKSISRKKAEKLGKDLLELIKEANNENLVIEEVKRLINAGADLEIKINGTEDTLLFLAIQKQFFKTVKELIGAGVNINHQNLLGRTVFFLNDNIEPLLNDLINAGAKLNIRDKNGDTPLMWACNHNYTNSAKLLINAGADVNLQNKNGYTALILAVYNDEYEIAKNLIEAGADASLKDTNGFEAINYAGSGPMAKLLSDAKQNKKANDKIEEERDEFDFECKL